MKTNRKIFLKISLVALLLTLAVSLVGCQSAALFLIDRLAPTEAKETVGNDVSATPSVSDPSLHRLDIGDSIVKSNAEPSVYGSAGTDVFAISDVVRMVSDSVVQIYTQSNSGSGAGSGVIISSEDGYILTCNHVVEGASTMIVELANNSRYDAKLVGTDAGTDLAVIKITPKEEEPLTAAKHGVSANLVAGEYVVAIGNPLGTLGGTVSHGIISATERQVPFKNSDGSTTTMNLIQTDAAINSGNSGGGLFNLKGELIGIVNAKYASTGVEGLGFAIPIDSAYKVEIDLIMYGFVRGIPDSGLSFLAVTSSNLRYYNYYYGITTTGLYVTSSKYSTDIHNLDRVTKVNGEEVNTVNDYNKAVDGLSVGDTITVEYVRYSGRTGTSYTTTIQLREYVPDSAAISFN